MQWLEGAWWRKRQPACEDGGRLCSDNSSGRGGDFCFRTGVIKGRELLKLIPALTACTSRRMNSEGGSCFADFAARERKRKAKPGKPRTGGAAACSKPQNPALCAPEGDGPCACGRTLCSLMRIDGKNKWKNIKFQLTSGNRSNIIKIK